MPPAGAREHDPQITVIEQELFNEKRSKADKYRDLVIGRPGLWPLNKFELVMLAASWVPGALGLFLRAKLYPTVLGRVGRNFAAGMSGGIAYVLDLEGDFERHVNADTVELDPLGEEDLELIQRMVRRHFAYTRSARADEVLRKWNTLAPRFVKVFPRDYKRALTERIAAESGNG